MLGQAFHAERPGRQNMSGRPGEAGKERTRQAIQVREGREFPAGQGRIGCTGKDREVSSRQDRASRGMQERQAGRRGQCSAGQGRAGQFSLVRPTI